MRNSRCSNCSQAQVPQILRPISFVFDREETSLPDWSDETCASFLWRCVYEFPGCPPAAAAVGFAIVSALRWREQQRIEQVECLSVVEVNCLRNEHKLDWDCRKLVVCSEWHLACRSHRNPLELPEVFSLLCTPNLCRDTSFLERVGYSAGLSVGSRSNPEATDCVAAYAVLRWSVDFVWTSLEFEREYTLRPIATFFANLLSFRFESVHFPGTCRRCCELDLVHALLFVYQFVVRGWEQWAFSLEQQLELERFYCRRRSEREKRRRFSPTDWFVVERPICEFSAEKRAVPLRVVELESEKSTRDRYNLARPKSRDEHCLFPLPFQIDFSENDDE